MPRRRRDETEEFAASEDPSERIYPKSPESRQIADATTLPRRARVIRATVEP
jgi:hypothetical protein